MKLVPILYLSCRGCPNEIVVNHTNNTTVHKLLFQPLVLHPSGLSSVAVVRIPSTAPDRFQTMQPSSNYQNRWKSQQIDVRAPFPAFSEKVLVHFQQYVYMHATESVQETLLSIRAKHSPEKQLMQSSDAELRICCQPDSYPLHGPQTVPSHRQDTKLRRF